MFKLIIEGFGSYDYGYAVLYILIKSDYNF